MSNILIVGMGVVGHNLSKELEALNPDVYDVDQSKCDNTKRNIMYDVAFICVDTPLVNGELNITSVIKAMKETKAEVIVIKSTVPVGTTQCLATSRHVIFSPEYYGATVNSLNLGLDFTVLGGDPEYCDYVINIIQRAYKGSHKFIKTDSKTAELAKFMENSWLATKVVFCNVFNDLSKQYGVSYNSLREIFVLDPRVNPSHTQVYQDQPYYESHCLDKDVPHIANYDDSEFLKNVIKNNENRKKSCA